MDGSLNASDIERYVSELKTNLNEINKIEPVLNILTKLGDRSIRVGLIDNTGSEVGNIVCQVKDGKVVRLDSGGTEKTDIEVTLDTRALQYIMEKPTKDRFFRQYLKRRIRIKGVSVSDLI
jgi:hypothetical protein